MGGRVYGFLVLKFGIWAWMYVYIVLAVGWSRDYSVIVNSRRLRVIQQVLVVARHCWAQ